MPAPVITGLIYTVCVTFVALLVCLFLPSFRFMIEAIAVSRLLIAIFAFAFPAPGALIVGSPLLMALLIVGYGVLVSRVMHGRIVRQSLPGLRERLSNLATGHRLPAMLDAHPAQHRLVGWLDDAIPVPARA